MSRLADLVKVVFCSAQGCAGFRDPSAALRVSAYADGQRVDSLRSWILYTPSATASIFDLESIKPLTLAQCWSGASLSLIVFHSCNNDHLNPLALPLPMPLPRVVSPRAVPLAVPRVEPPLVPLVVAVLPLLAVETPGGGCTLLTNLTDRVDAGGLSTKEVSVVLRSISHPIPIKFRPLVTYKNVASTSPLCAINPPTPPITSPPPPAPLPFAPTTLGKLLSRSLIRLKLSTPGASLKSTQKALMFIPYRKLAKFSLKRAMLSSSN